MPQEAASRSDPLPLSLGSIKVATGSLAASNTPIWLAQDKGLFRKYGLQVDLSFLSATTGTQALMAGDVPMTPRGASLVGAFVSGGRDLVFVAGIVNKAVFKIYARPDLRQSGDLRGKILGTNQAGSSAAIATEETLKRLGLDPEKDVEVTHLRDSATVFAALTGGAIAAGTLSSPTTEAAAKEGFRLLVDMADLNIEMMSINVATTRTFARDHRDVVTAFLKGYVDGIREARADPQGATESIMKWAKIDDRELAEGGYKEYERVWDPSLSQPGIQRVLDGISSPDARSVSPADLVDGSFIAELTK